MKYLVMTHILMIGLVGCLPAKDGNQDDRDNLKKRVYNTLKEDLAKSYQS